MPITENYNLDIDTTLGGSNASDYVIPSQKAVKDYVDNHSSGGTSIPDPTGHSGEFLTNNGTAVSWGPAISTITYTPSTETLAFT